MGLWSHLWVWEPTYGSGVPPVGQPRVWCPTYGSEHPTYGSGLPLMDPRTPLMGLWSHLWIWEPSCGAAMGQGSHLWVRAATYGSGPPLVGQPWGAPYCRGRRCAARCSPTRSEPPPPPHRTADAPSAASGRAGTPGGHTGVRGAVGCYSSPWPLGGAVVAMGPYGLSWALWLQWVPMAGRGRCALWAMGCYGSPWPLGGAVLYGLRGSMVPLAAVGRCGYNGSLWPLWGAVVRMAPYGL